MNMCDVRNNRQIYIYVDLLLILLFNPLKISQKKTKCSMFLSTNLICNGATIFVCEKIKIMLELNEHVMIIMEKQILYQ